MPEMYENGCSRSLFGLRKCYYHFIKHTRRCHPEEMAIIGYCQRSSTGLISWVMTGMLAFELSSSIRPFRQQRRREECEARGAQQSYSAINRVIFPRNAKHRKRLSSKNTEVKRKLCLAALVYEPRLESVRSYGIYYSHSFFSRARNAERKRTREFAGSLPSLVTHDQGNDPADRTYIMQRTIATLEIRFTRLRLSQWVVGQAFPGHLKSEAPQTIDGERCGKR